MTTTSMGTHPTAAGAFTLASPAKINLYLRIVGRRPDGFHELETVMAPLAFGDEIEFAPRPDGLAFACDDPRLPTDSKNLAVRAAELLRDRFQVRQGASIRLRKRIPLAAGLGGGSGNAATVLRGLNQLWHLHAPPAVLDEFAAQMGSDINFFLQPSPALCRGRGEQVEPLPSRCAATVLLLKPEFGIATKWAYARWAALAPALTVSAPPVSVLRQALGAGDLAGVAAGLYNALEVPALHKFPVLDLLKDALRAAGAAGALMSGSGSTVFGLFAEPAAATQAAESVRAEFGPSLWSVVTRLTGVVE